MKLINRFITLIALIGWAVALGLIFLMVQISQGNWPFEPRIQQSMSCPPGTYDAGDSCKHEPTGCPYGENIPVDSAKCVLTNYANKAVPITDMPAFITGGGK